MIKAQKDKEFVQKCKKEGRMINKPRDSNKEPLSEDHVKEIEQRIKNVTDRLS